MNIYIDMDDAPCDFIGEYHKAIERTLGIQYLQSQFGFFERLPPIPEAISAVNEIIQSEEYDPYVLTAPSTKNPFSYLEKRIWIEKYFVYPFVEKLIICSNKALLKGEILIDDNFGKGQEGFEGQLIHFGSDEFPDWGAVSSHLCLQE